MEIPKKIESKIVGWKLTSKSSTQSRSDDIAYTSAPKRPKELVCDIKKLKIKGEQWTMFVGLMNGKPYEIFGGLSKFVDIPNKNKVGKIAKEGKGGSTKYNLIIGEGDDEMVIKDIANVFENMNHGSFTRLLSLSLRHGVPLQYVVEQLQKDKHSDITSFSRVMARVIKEYVKDGTVSSGEKKCPQCGAENSLVYKSGCLGCKECLYEGCG